VKCSLRTLLISVKIGEIRGSFSGFICADLRHLRIESSFFNELKFVNFLCRLPSLVSLELVDCEDASSHLLKGLTTTCVGSTLVCPKLETLSLDGCTNLDWDSLRTFIEVRIPGRSFACHWQPHNRRLLTDSIASVSSASTYAQLRHGPAPATKPIGIPQPKRLRSIDVTRCHQISKEMVQWLRMYVAEVRCDPAKGVWGEAVLP